MVVKVITQANRNLDKFTILIDDLLDASKVNDGQLYLHKKLIISSQAIKNCCIHIHLAGQNTLKIEGDLEIKVYADAERFTQITLNFVNYAMKYAPYSKEIKVIIEKVNGMVKVSVIDKGSGIEAEKIPHLFERNYQAERNETKYTTGLD